MIRGVFIFAAMMLAGSYAFPAESRSLNDRIIVEIARQVIAQRGSTSDPAPLDATSIDVRKWLLSIGGDTYFKNYLDKFGYQIGAGRALTAALIDLSNKNLGVYYIHAAPISSDTMTKDSCAASMEDSITLRGFCALGNRDAALLFSDRAALDRFRTLARWFLDNQKDGRWEWSVGVPLRNQKAPWISSLSQSLGISVLLREYQLDNDSAYLAAAGRALSWMRKTAGEGGVSLIRPVGVWYEEYPDESNPSHVLNGHMWALFGIWDFYRVTRDPVAKQMFDDGVIALKAELDRYDVGYWSVYAQTNRVDMVDGNYQHFIIEQLRVLHAITAIELFKETADRWEKAMRNDELFIHNAAREFLKAP